MLLPATLVVPAHIEPRVRVHVQPWLLSSLQLVGGYCGLAVRGDSSHLIAMSRACLADIGSQECKPGDYCFNDVNFTCPPKSTSRADASSYLDCSCNAGYYNASVQSPTSLCQSCLASSYCTGGGSIQACRATRPPPRNLPAMRAARATSASRAWTTSRAPRAHRPTSATAGCAHRARPAASPLCSPGRSRTVRASPVATGLQVRHGHTR